MQMNKIPLNPLPNQTFRVELTIDDRKQTFYVFLGYREICGYWVMTLMDTYQNRLLSNIPLVTGGGLNEAGNLLKQFGYMKLGSILISKAPYVTDDIPNENNLGTDFVMYWGDTQDESVT